MEFFFSLCERISVNWVGRKESLYISKIAKFESDFLKTNENISPHSRVILQTFLQVRSNLPPPPPPPPIQMSVDFRSFVELYLFAHLQDVSLSNLAILLIVMGSLQWCRRIFPDLSMSKVEKNVEVSIDCVIY